MRRRLVISALFALFGLLGVAASQAEVVPDGNVLVKFDAEFDPHLLPRQKPAPVRIKIERLDQDHRRQSPPAPADA